MLTAAAMMTSAVITVSPDTSIHEIAKLLREHNISGVPVIGDGERVLDIVSESDLIEHAKRSGEQRHSWPGSDRNDVEWQKDRRSGSPLRSSVISTRAMHDQKFREPLGSSSIQRMHDPSGQ
jgi:CBS-domain-containing membrane protein